MGPLRAARRALTLRSMPPLLPLPLLLLMLYLLMLAETRAAPVLSGASIDLTSGTVTLKFSQLVRTQSLNASRVYVQSMANSTHGGHARRLTGNREVVVSNSTSAVLTMPDDDLNFLLFHDDIATSTADTFVRVLQGAVISVDGKEPNDELRDGEAVAVSSWVGDSLTPFVEWWTVDMDLALFAVQFTEPVNVSTLDSSHVVFQSDENIFEEEAEGLTVAMGSGMNVSWATDDLEYVVFNIGDDNYNLIKLGFPLMDDIESSYLVIDGGFIYDLAGNELSASGLYTFDAMRAMNYTKDSTPPRLRNFTLNMNVGSLQLGFSEAVDVSTFNTSLLAIQNGDNESAISVSLEDSTVTTDADSDIIRIEMSTANMESITRHTLSTSKGFATSLTNSYISLGEGAVRDINTIPNDLVGVPPSDAFQARGLAPDVTSPRLNAFSLNLTAQQLVLTFSEVVAVTDISVQLLSLQSESAFSTQTTQFVDLSSSTQPTDTDAAAVVTLQLSDNDFASIKSTDDIGTDATHTYASLTTGFVSDVAGNKIVRISSDTGLLVANFVPDTIAPTLESWTLDWATRTVELQFSEPVAISSFVPQTITLISTNPLRSHTSTYTILATTLATTSDSEAISIDLDSEEEASIKLLRHIGRANTSAYIVLNSSAFTDTETFDANGTSYVNNVREVLEQQPQVVGTFVADEAVPVLQAFEVDLSTGQFLLSFDEPVDGGTVQAANMTISAKPIALEAQDTPQLPLSRASYAIAENGVNLTVQLSVQDWTTMLSLNGTADSANTTAVTLHAGVLADMFGNTIGVNDTQKIAARAYKLDTVAPTLLGWTLVGASNDKANISLFFDEPVDPDSIDERLWVFQTEQINSRGEDDTAQEGFNLRTFEDSYRIDFQFSSTTEWDYLSWVSGAISDVAGNAIAGQSSSLGRERGLNLVSCRLDFERQTLVFVFSSAVRINTFDARDMTFYDASSIDDATESMSPSDEGTASVFVEDNMVLLRFSSADFETLQEFTSLGKATNQFYVSPASTAVKDELGNAVLVPDTTDLIGATSVVPDTTTPVLSSFDFSMATGTLTLRFSEPVDPSTVVIPALTFWADVPTNVTVANFTMSTPASSVTTSSPASVIAIDLDAVAGESDLDRFHAERATLGVDTSSLYLSALEGFVLDTAATPNFHAEITVENPMQVTTLTFDTANPTVDSVILDMNANLVSILFSERVDCRALDPADVSIVNSATSSSSSNYLAVLLNTTAEVIPTTTAERCNISFTDDTILSLKENYPNIGASLATSYMTIAAGAVSDIAHGENPLIGIAATDAFQFTEVVLDTTSPAVDTFALDLDSQTLTITFDDVMDCNAVNVSSVVLQPAAFAGTSTDVHSFTPASTTVTCTALSPKIVLDIGDDDKNSLSVIPALAVSKATTYLRVTSTAFQDVFGNAVTGILDGLAVSAASFSSDVTQPQLRNYYLYSRGAMFLRFDESIDIDSFDMTSITFADTADASTASTYAVTISAGVLDTSSDDQTEVEIDISDDINAAQAQGIASLQSNCFISMQSSAFQDVYGNVISNFSLDSSVQTGPVLFNFDLNMDTGVLTIIVSDDVYANLTLSGVTVHNRADGSGDSNVTFSDGYKVLSTDGSGNKQTFGTDIEMRLSDDDVLALKSGRGLAKSASNTYFSAAFGVGELFEDDVEGSPLQTLAIDPSEAVAVRTYTPDSTPPTVLSWEVNLGLGQLLIVFDEPINTQTVNGTAISVMVESGSDVLTMSTFQSIVQVETNVTFALSAADLNGIKKIQSKGDPVSFMFFTSAAFEDTAGNQIVEITDNDPVSGVVLPDNVPPTLENADMDFSEGVLTLTFDEAVSFANFSSENVLLIAGSNISDTGNLPNFRFTNLTRVTTSTAAAELDFGSLRGDSLAIKLLSGLANDQSTTYIYIDDGTIEDEAHNALTPFTQAVQVDNYTTDTQQPAVRSFSYLPYTSHGTLELIFSEPINTTTFNATKFILQASLSNAPNVSYRVAGSVETTDVLAIAVTLTGVRTASGIGGDNTTLFLHNEAAGAVDSFGNELSALAGSDSLLNGVQLLSFELDMDVGSLLFVFADAISISDFNVTHVSISGTSATDRHTLEGGVVAGYSGGNNFDTVITVSLLPTDVRALQLLDSVATSVSTSRIVLTPHASENEDGVSTAPITHSTGTTARIFTPDTTQPQAISTRLDMDRSRLALVFSEPVRASSVVPSKLILQNDVSAPTASYTLTNSKVISENNDTVIIKLSGADSKAIKLQTELATEANTTYVATFARTAFDMAGNAAPKIVTTAALSVALFEPDVTNPQLEEFDIDMNTGLLVLYFDEPINASSFDPTQLRLQDGYAGSTQVYTLTGGTWNRTRNDDVLELTLLGSDLKNIKRVDGLAITLSNTFLIATTSTVRDMAGNALTVVPDGAALLVSDFSLEDVPPVLNRFDLDINAGTLSLYFSETMRVSTLDPTAISLQNVKTYDVLNAGHTQFFFSTASALANETGNSRNLTLLLAQRDLNSIKSLGNLSTDVTNTYLSTLSGTTPIADMAGNALTTVADSDAMQVTDYVRDSTVPTFIRFSLDMSRGSMSIVFSETVVEEPLNLAGVHLQSLDEARFGHAVAMVESTYARGALEESRTLTFHISNSTLNEMKINGIGRDTSSSFLTIDMDSIWDAVDLSVVAVLDESVEGAAPATPVSFVADSVSPNLIRFLVDRTERELHLIFDEAVDVASIEPTEMVLYSTSAGAPANGFRLMNQTMNVRTQDNASRVILDLMTACETTITNVSVATTVTHNGSLVNTTALVAVNATQSGLGCNWRNMSALGYFDRGENISLAVNETFVHDMALVPNLLAPITIHQPLPESDRICACASGFYISEPCRDGVIDDAICSECRTCPDDSYESAACGGHVDTECTRCTECRQDTYASTACGATSDTVCSPCTACGRYEYVRGACTSESDTDCGSCKVCEYASVAIEDKCRRTMRWWQEENCCFDADGTRVPCRSLDWAEMYISVRDGRRHWVFDTTDPDVPLSES